MTSRDTKEARLSWSPELTEETRATLANLPPTAFAAAQAFGRKGLCLRDRGRRHGYVTLSACLSDRYDILDRGTDGVVASFPDVDALIGAGWVLD